jgi:hypothetical protein
MSLQIFLVIGAILEPPVSNGQVKCRIGVGQYGDPLVGVDSVGVVAVGRYVDLPDPELRPPEAQPAGKLSSPTPRRGLLVAAPEQEKFGVPRDVKE